MKRILLSLTAAVLAMSAGTASANTVRGKIYRTEGHIAPNCRTVGLKKVDGSLVHFRIAATGYEDGVLAVTLTALTTGFEVEITFTPGATTGCGSEPRIEYITILGPEAAQSMALNGSGTSALQSGPSRTADMQAIQEID